MENKLTFSQFLMEAENKKLPKKEAKKKEQVYVDPDPQVPFPDATVSKIESEINKGAKDIDTVWDDADMLTKHAFKELNVPVPQAFLSERWKQYKKLLQIAIAALADTRGNSGKWRTTV